jgi:hypothetical protein
MAYNAGAGSGSGTPQASGFNQNIESTGLNTVSTTVPYAGAYFVKGKFTIPTLIDGQGSPGQASASSLVVTVNQNGTAKYTGPVGAEGFYTNLSCAAYDVIAFVLSSSAAVDAVNNAVKATYSIGQGQ